MKKKKRKVVQPCVRFTVLIKNVWEAPICNLVWIIREWLEQTSGQYWMNMVEDSIHLGDDYENEWMRFNLTFREIADGIEFYMTWHGTPDIKITQKVS